jgi:hypothetical protein
MRSFVLPVGEHPNNLLLDLAHPVERAFHRHPNSPE